MRQRLRGWRRKWLPLAPRWRQPFCPSVSASVGGPDQRMAQAADGAPIGRPLFKDRLAIVVLCDPIRALLGDKAFGLSLKVAFDPMIPTKHPYIAAFSKPRPVGRRRGGDRHRRQAGQRRESRLICWRRRWIASGPSPSACIARRQRNSCSAARPTWPGWWRPSVVCRRPVATPRRRGKAYPSSGRLRADR